MKLQWIMKLDRLDSATATLLCKNPVTGESTARLDVDREFWETAMIAQGVLTLEASRDVSDA